MQQEASGQGAHTQAAPSALLGKRKEAPGAAASIEVTAAAVEAMADTTMTDAPPLGLPQADTLVPVPPPTSGVALAGAQEVPERGGGSVMSARSATPSPLPLHGKLKRQRVDTPGYDANDERSDAESTVSSVGGVAPAAAPSTAAPAMRAWVRPSATTFEMPFAEQLTPTELKVAEIITPTVPASARQAANGGARVKCTPQDVWLFLGQAATLDTSPCSNQLKAVDIDRKPASERSRSPSSPVQITDHLDAISTLIYSLGAHIDAQDDGGWSAVHWLIFSAMWLPVGEAVIKGEDVDLSAVTRYTTEIEPTLMLLLSASEKIGYANPFKCRGDIGAEEEGATTCQAFPDSHIKKGSLLDIQDDAGNTALHYAVHNRRVDLVAMLLCHGASINVGNAKNRKPIDMVDWQKPSTAPPADASAQASNSTVSTTSSASTAIHPLIAKIDASVYSAVDRVVERRWGTSEGLRIEQCSYKGETDEGAVMRLLFQQALYDAVDAGDAGDEAITGKLVQVWQLAQKDGRPMFPLVYRADAFWQSPLQIAVAYEATDTVILQKLLRLPWSFHVQARVTDHAALHRALLCHNPAAVKMLQRAGYNIDHRDAATGQTAFVAAVNQEEETSGLSQQAFDRAVLKMTTDLFECGADPLIPDANGNDALTVSLFLGRLGLLRHIVQKLPRQRVQKWLTTTNKYGCAPMHYALYRVLPIAEVDFQLLEFMVALGGQVDGPKNLAGVTPIEAWTGAKSKFASRMAKAMHRTLAEAQRPSQPPQRTWLSQADVGKVFEADLTNGKEGHGGVIMRSGFEMTEADRPQFTYSKKLIATESSTVFVESSKNKKTQSDRQLQEMVFRFHRDPVTYAPATTLEVRMTPLKGWGLFTKKTILKEAAIEVVGEVIGAWEEEDRTIAQLQKNEVFILPKYRLYDRVRVYAIDNRRIGNLTRFINHSCTGANLSCYNTSTGRVCLLYAARDIPAGEELTINYGLDHLTPRATCICRCGASQCFGQLI